MPSPDNEAVHKRGASKQHRLDLKISDTLADGSLDFYSDRFTLHLELLRSRVSGSAIISGKDHSLKVGMKPDNRWDLEYSHERDSRIMSLFTEYGAVKKAENLFGVSHRDRNHDIQLAYRERLGIHGHVKGKTRYLNFDLHFTQKQTSSLEIQHTAKDHDVKLKFFTDGTYEFRAMVKIRRAEVVVSKNRHRIEAEVSVPF